MKNKEEYTLTENKTSIIQWCQLLKTEYETIFKNKIPVNITFVGKENNDDKYIINEKIDPSYETRIYVIYMYKKIKQMNITDFKRIINPLKDYNELIDMIKDKDNVLSIFADIKNNV